MLLKVPTRLIINVDLIEFLNCHILSIQQRNNGTQPAFCIRIHTATWRQAD